MASSYRATINYYGKLVKDGKVDSEVVRTALRKSAAYGEALVKATSPVRSGKYQAGWSVRPVAAGLAWKNPMPYAGYVELGTKYMKGQHIMEKALYRTTQYFQVQLGRELGSRVAVQAIRAYLDYPSLKKGTSGVGFG